MITSVKIALRHSVAAQQHDIAFEDFVHAKILDFEVSSIN